MRIEIDTTKKTDGKYNIEIYIDGDCICDYKNVTTEDIGAYVTSEIEHYEEMETE